MNKHTIITIGRQYGSGGREIGQKLAAKNNIKCYDKEILTESAKNSGFDERLFEENDESAKRHSLLYSLVMGEGLSVVMGSQPLPVALYLEEFHTIKEIAQKESCIFVGRCSDYVLREFDNVVNIFIHAPLQARINRVCKRRNITQDKAKALIAKVDKTRASYYNYHTDQKWGAAKNYHISLDTEKIGIDGAVDVIEMYLDFFRKLS